MSNSIRYIDDKNGNHVLPVTHERAVRDSSGVNLETKLASLDSKSYVVAWNGESTPVAANIPSGVSVTYNGTTYNGSLAASSSTIGKIYLVSDGTDFDRYVTSQSGSSYSWLPLGSTQIYLSDYATKDELSQLEAEVHNEIDGVNGPVAVTKVATVPKRIASGGGAFTNSTDIKTDSFAVIAGNTYHIVVPKMSSAYTAVYGFGDEAQIDQNIAHITLPDPVVKGSVTNYEADVVIPAGLVALYVCYDIAGGSPTVAINVHTEGLKDRVDDLEYAVEAIQEDLTDAQTDIETIENRLDFAVVEFPYTKVDGYYINNAGGASARAGAAYFIYSSPNPLKTIRLKGTAVGGVTSTILFSDHNTLGSSLGRVTYSGTIDEVVTVPAGTKYIFLDKFDNTEILTISEPVYDIPNITPSGQGGQLFGMNKEILDGYWLNGYGGLTARESSAVVVYTGIPSGMKKIRLKGDAIGGATYTICFQNGTEVLIENKIYGRTYTGATDRWMEVPTGTTLIAISRFSDSETVDIADVVFDIDTPESINKPFVFSSKKALFFGDSITAGVISSSGGLSTDANKGYAKLLCNHLGMTISNKGVSGSLFTKDDNWSIATIKDTVLETTEAADFIFIAGGCNDYERSVEIGDLDSTDEYELCGALNLICTYLQSNYSGAVVTFITPINICRGWGSSKNANTGTSPLDDYRQAIFRVVSQYGYNVIDGSSIGFPTDKGDYSDIMVYDGVHPTEDGHKMYARSLAGKLL